MYLSIHQFAWWAIDCTVNQGYTNPTVGYFFNISKCKYWYIKLLVGYQYPRSGSWLIGIRYLNIVTFRQYLKFRNSVSNRSFWPCFVIVLIAFVRITYCGIATNNLIYSTNNQTLLMFVVALGYTIVVVVGQFQVHIHNSSWCVTSYS